MLSLTRKTEYALIAMSHLASKPERLASAREIADLYRIPLPVLTNILKTLNRSGLVESERGVRGGYRLAQDPQEISLATLIGAIEGPVRLVKCSSDRKSKSHGDCGLMAWCPVRSPALRIHDRLHRFLEEVSLDEIVAQGEPARAARAQREEEPAP